jgi:hypothetical protein
MTNRIAVRHIAAAWRTLTWRHAGAALLIGTLFFLTNLRFLVHNGLSGPVVSGFVLRHVVVGCILMLAIVAADRLVDHGAPRLRTYAAALTTAALLSDPVAAQLSWLLHWHAADVVPAAFNLTGPVGVVIKGGLGAAAYVRWREVRMTSEALRRSQLQRADDLRRLQETRLQTLQARVDPQFLFDALGQVATLQQHDPAAADSLLNELIALLRELMPHERADASTVAREFALAVSYLRILAAAISALTVEVSIAPGAGEARLPPMLLVPLLSAVLAARTGAVPRLTLQADTSTDRVRIQLNVSSDVNPSILGSVELTRLRAQLLELYGEVAVLSVQTSRGFGALIEVPRESAWRSDQV